MDKQESSPSPTDKKQSLKDLISQKRSAKKVQKEMASIMIADPYEPAYSFKEKIKKGTLYYYLPSVEHANIWEANHPENSQRSIMLHERLTETDILGRLTIMQENDLIKGHPEGLLLLVHSFGYVRKARQLLGAAKEEDFTMYDSIYSSGNKTYDAALKAAQVCVSMAEKIVIGGYSTGFANIRPPGHHATVDEPNGYCFFNNIAITAEYLIRNTLLERILIVDFDIHHGQGTQRQFYNSPGVLYISIHRYEHGNFWPNLPESDYTYIGGIDGVGYNINVPLNMTGLTDTDYLAILHNIILPVAYEFNPQIILCSAGYDSCMGCPEGQMEVTPAFYGHLITSLLGLAEGKLLCLLEGGYYPPSLAEGAYNTIRALLGDFCNPIEIHKHVNPTVIDTINNVKSVLRPHWRCFQIDLQMEVDNPLYYDRYNDHVAIDKYFGQIQKPPFNTRLYYPTNNKDMEDMVKLKLTQLKKSYSNALTVVAITRGYGFHEHAPQENSRAQEIPERITAINDKLTQFNIFSRLKEIPPRSFDVQSYLDTTHEAQYISCIMSNNLPQKPDLYINKHTSKVCQDAISALMNLAAAIHNKQATSAVGIVRPPGHHARKSQGGGFCLVNNIAVLANYLTVKYDYERVLIIDFDIHHGDGTQDITYNRDDIMYISLHRFDEGKFFPQWLKSDYNFIGSGKSAGYNVNIPFNSAKMGDSDYIFTWFKIVLPLAYAYEPEIILVSAGFDAGINDPLGHYLVSPETFGHLIQTIKSIAPVMLVLEGGYNLETTSLSMTMCVKALLGDPIPSVRLDQIKPETKASIQKVISIIKPYWPILEVNKRLGNRIVKQSELDSRREGNMGHGDDLFSCLTPELM